MEKCVSIVTGCMLHAAQAHAMRRRFMRPLWTSCNAVSEMVRIRSRGVSALQPVKRCTHAGCAMTRR